MAWVLSRMPLRTILICVAVRGIAGIGAAEGQQVTLRKAPRKVFPPLTDSNSPAF